MPAPRSRTPEGDAVTEVILRTFRANGRFLAAGDLLAGQDGLTSARWQVLGALALSDRALTVPQIARRMGLTRQSVQSSINRLRNDGLIEAERNPDHRRSPLIRLTALGTATYERLHRRQVKWANALADGLDVLELATAARVLDQLSNRLNSTTPSGGEDR